MSKNAIKQGFFAKHTVHTNSSKNVQIAKRGNDVSIKVLPPQFEIKPHSIASRHTISRVTLIALDKENCAEPCHRRSCSITPRCSGISVLQRRSQSIMISDDCKLRLPLPSVSSFSFHLAKIRFMVSTSPSKHLKHSLRPYPDCVPWPWTKMTA